MNTVLLIASKMMFMVHSSDLGLNESLGTTYPSCSPDYRWSTKFGKCVDVYMDKIESGFTSNILLGCVVVLLAVLTLLKVFRYVLRCKSNHVYQNRPERQNTSRYDSQRFALSSRTTPLDDLQGTTCGRSRVGTC